MTVGELLDAMKADYDLRSKWNDRTDSTVKKVRDKFGLWRATSVTSEAIATWQLELRQQKYRDATIKPILPSPKAGIQSGNRA
jgi:hypothetical protein